jgi:hypothetical protein
MQGICQRFGKSREQNPAIGRPARQIDSAVQRDDGLARADITLKKAMHRPTQTQIFINFFTDIFLTLRHLKRQLLMPRPD